MAPIIYFPLEKSQAIKHTFCWSNQKDQECMAPIWPFTCKDQGIKHTFCQSKKSWCWLQTLQQATCSHISDYPCCILTSLNAYSYKYLEVHWLPKRTQLWACEPNTPGCTEGSVYFPQSCRNTHFPHFLDCLLNTTLIPCLLVFFLSILHERVCD